MKLHLHQILISLIIGCLIGFGAAQWRFDSLQEARWKKGGMRQMMMQKLEKELRLSADQKKQIETIFEAQHPKMAALHDQMRPKFEALRNETQEKIRNVLKAEQQKKFEEMSAQWAARMKERQQAWMK